MQRANLRQDEDEIAANVSSYRLATAYPQRQDQEKAQQLAHQEARRKADESARRQRRAREQEDILASIREERLAREKSGKLAKELAHQQEFGKKAAAFAQRPFTSSKVIPRRQIGDDEDSYQGSEDDEPQLPTSFPMIPGIYNDESDEEAEAWRPLRPFPAASDAAASASASTLAMSATGAENAASRSGLVDNVEEGDGAGEGVSEDEGGLIL